MHSTKQSTNLLQCCSGGSRARELVVVQSQQRGRAPAAQLDVRPAASRELLAQKARQSEGVLEGQHQESLLELAALDAPQCLLVGGWVG